MKKYFAKIIRPLKEDSSTSSTQRRKSSSASIASTGSAAPVATSAQEKADLKTSFAGVLDQIVDDAHKFLNARRHDSGDANNTRDALSVLLQRFEKPTPVSRRGLAISATVDDKVLTFAMLTDYLNISQGARTSISCGLPTVLVQVLEELKYFDYELDSSKTDENASDKRALEENRKKIQQAFRYITQMLVILVKRNDITESLRAEVGPLLTMAVASYPSQSKYIPQFACQILKTIAENSLSAGLVWFFHDSSIVAHAVNSIQNLVDSHTTSDNTSSTSAKGSDTHTPSAGSAPASGKPNVESLPISTFPNAGVSIGGGASLEFFAVDDRFALAAASATEKAQTQHDTVYPTHESDGLYVVGISAILSLVVHSCRFSLALLKDFEEASGYELLRKLIRSASRGKLRAMLQQLCFLIPTGEGYPKEGFVLPTSKAAVECTDSGSILTSSFGSASMEDGDRAAMARNLDAFMILHDLLIHSVASSPIKRSRGAGGDASSQPPSTDTKSSELEQQRVEESLEELAAAASTDQRHEFRMQLLCAILDVYSTHPRNYDTLEPRCNILSTLIKLIPIMSSMELKIMILKTLEYVASGCGSTHTAPEAALHSLCDLLLLLGPGPDIEQSASVPPARQYLSSSSVTSTEIEALTRRSSVQFSYLDPKLAAANIDHVRLVCDSLVRIIKIDGPFFKAKLHECGLLERILHPLLATTAATIIADGTPAALIAHLCRLASSWCMLLATLLARSPLMCLDYRKLELHNPLCLIAAHADTQCSKAALLCFPELALLGSHVSWSSVSGTVSLHSAPDRRSEPRFPADFTPDELRLLENGVLDDIMLLLEVFQGLKAEHDALLSSPRSAPQRKDINRRRTTILDTIAEMLAVNAKAKEAWRVHHGFESAIAALSGIEGCPLSPVALSSVSAKQPQQPQQPVDKDELFTLLRSVLIAITMSLESLDGNPFGDAANRSYMKKDVGYETLRSSIDGLRLLDTTFGPQIADVLFGMICGSPEIPSEKKAIKNSDKIGGLMIKNADAVILATALAIEHEEIACCVELMTRLNQTLISDKANIELLLAGDAREWLLSQTVRQFFIRQHQNVSAMRLQMSLFVSLLVAHSSLPSELPLLFLSSGLQLPLFSSSPAREDDKENLNKSEVSDTAEKSVKNKQRDIYANALNLLSSMCESSINDSYISLGSAMARNYSTFYERTSTISSQEVKHSMPTSKTPTEEVQALAKNLHIEHHGLDSIGPGIELKSSTPRQWPPSSGYTFSCWVRVRPVISKQYIPLLPQKVIGKDDKPTALVQAASDGEETRDAELSTIKRDRVVVPLCMCEGQARVRRNSHSVWIDMYVQAQGKEIHFFDTEEDAKAGVKQRGSLLLGGQLIAGAVSPRSHSGSLLGSFSANVAAPLEVLSASARQENSQRPDVDDAFQNWEVEDSTAHIVEVPVYRGSGSQLSPRGRENYQLAFESQAEQRRWIETLNRSYSKRGSSTQEECGRAEEQAIVTQVDMTPPITRNGGEGNVDTSGSDHSAIVDTSGSDHSAIILLDWCTVDDKIFFRMSLNMHTDTVEVSLNGKDKDSTPITAEFKAVGIDYRSTQNTSKIEHNQNNSHQETQGTLADVFEDLSTRNIGKTGKWHHLLFVHKKAVVGHSVATLYVDGREHGKTNLAYPASNTNILMNGRLGVMCAYPPDGSSGSLLSSQHSEECPSFSKKAESPTPREIDVDLGSCFLAEEPLVASLSTTTAAAIWMLGPSHIGTKVGQPAYRQFPASLSAWFLQRICTEGETVFEAAMRLGLSRHVEASISSVALASLPASASAPASSVLASTSGANISTSVASSAPGSSSTNAFLSLSASTQKAVFTGGAAALSAIASASENSTRSSLLLLSPTSSTSVEPQMSSTFQKPGMRRGSSMGGGGSTAATKFGQLSLGWELFKKLTSVRLPDGEKIVFAYDPISVSAGPSGRPATMLLDTSGPDKVSASVSSAEKAPTAPQTSSLALPAHIGRNAMVVQARSLADTLRGAGGVILLLMMIERAEHLSNLCALLRLCSAMLRLNLGNLEAMRRHKGYLVIVGLLARKPEWLIEEVQELAFDISVTEASVPLPKTDSSRENFVGIEGPHYTGKRFYSPLLCNTIAMHQLLFNFQAWRPATTKVQANLLCLLHGLIGDDNANAYFNAQQLRVANIVPWLLNSLFHQALLLSERKRRGASSKVRDRVERRQSSDAEQKEAFTEDIIEEESYIAAAGELLERLFSLVLCCDDIENISDFLVATMTFSTSASCSSTSDVASAEPFSTLLPDLKKVVNSYRRGTESSDIVWILKGLRHVRLMLLNVMLKVLTPTKADFAQIDAANSAAKSTTGWSSTFNSLSSSAPMVSTSKWIASGGDASDHPDGGPAVFAYVLSIQWFSCILVSLPFNSAADRCGDPIQKADVTRGQEQSVNAMGNMQAQEERDTVIIGLQLLVSLLRRSRSFEQEFWTDDVGFWVLFHTLSPFSNSPKVYIYLLELLTLRAHWEHPSASWPEQLDNSTAIPKSPSSSSSSSVLLSQMIGYLCAPALPISSSIPCSPTSDVPLTLNAHARQILNLILNLMKADVANQRRTSGGDASFELVTVIMTFCCHLARTNTAFALLFLEDQVVGSLTDFLHELLVNSKENVTTVESGAIGLAISSSPLVEITLQLMTSVVFASLSEEKENFALRLVRLFDVPTAMLSATDLSSIGPTAISPSHSSLCLSQKLLLSRLRSYLSIQMSSEDWARALGRNLISVCQAIAKKVQDCRLLFSVEADLLEFFLELLDSARMAWISISSFSSSSSHGSANTNQGPSLETQIVTEAVCSLIGISQQFVLIHLTHMQDLVVATLVGDRQMVRQSLDLIWGHREALVQATLFSTTERAAASSSSRWKRGKLLASHSSKEKIAEMDEDFAIGFLTANYSFRSGKAPKEEGRRNSLIPATPLAVASELRTQARDYEVIVGKRVLRAHQIWLKRWKHEHVLASRLWFRLRRRQITNRIFSPQSSASSLLFLHREVLAIEDDNGRGEQNERTKSSESKGVGDQPLFQLVVRWKLDSTEGPFRMRRRLRQNEEFETLYGAKPNIPSPSDDHVMENVKDSSDTTISDSNRASAATKSLQELSTEDFVSPSGLSEPGRSDSLNFIIDPHQGILQGNNGLSNEVLKHIVQQARSRYEDFEKDEEEDEPDDVQTPPGSSIDDSSNTALQANNHGSRDIGQIEEDKQAEASRTSKFQLVLNEEDRDDGALSGEEVDTEEKKSSGGRSILAGKKSRRRKSEIDDFGANVISEDQEARTAPLVAGTGARSLGAGGEIRPALEAADGQTEGGEGFGGAAIMLDADSRGDGVGGGLGMLDAMTETSDGKERKVDDVDVREKLLSLLDPLDRPPSKVYNCKRVTGTMAMPALFIISRYALYVVDGFECRGEDGSLLTSCSYMSASATVVEIAPSSQTYSSAVLKSAPRQAEDGEMEKSEGKALQESAKQKRRRSSLAKEGAPMKEIRMDVALGSGFEDETSPEEHRSLRTASESIREFHRRRYQLRPVAIEFFEVDGTNFLVGFMTEQEREEVYQYLFTLPLQNSVFSTLSAANTNSVSGAAIIAAQWRKLRNSMTRKWLDGSVTNFEYLMQLNTLAGRSFNDLTQYPVFPWILRDYSSESLDINNPHIYRPLDKPMGAIGSERAVQFQERYESLKSGYDPNDPMGPPPFNYGTHYSCSGYIINYLLRLEPFSRMGLDLQGGRFDRADRLFRDIGASWKSASEDNLQDVRELIPEFFYLPEFLLNSNKFDFGQTQRGDIVDDVVLPQWANGDAREFIRVHRRALESKYVSENLHHWVDLVFGYKQRGKAAVESQNVFMHITYEGEVDVDKIEDPLIRLSTIAQIENFGQTPSRLFKKPHPGRKVPAYTSDQEILSDPDLLRWFSNLAPPLCLLNGKGVHIKLCSFARISPNPIGDVKLLSKDKILTCGENSLLLPEKFTKYVKWNFPDGGIRFFKSSPSSSSSTSGSNDKLYCLYQYLHQYAVTCLAVSEDGQYIVTGSQDGIGHLFVVITASRQHHLRLQEDLCGHTDKITCIKVSRAFNAIVTGSSDKSAIIWDLRRSCYVRDLQGHTRELTALDINPATGDIITMAGPEIRVWSINGELLAAENSFHINLPMPTCLATTPCQDWQDGVCLITGHSDGSVCLWRLSFRPDLSYSAAVGKSSAEKNDFAVKPPQRPSLFIDPLKQTLIEVQLKRKLENVQTLQDPHQSSITAIHLGSSSREFATADALGYVGRWASFETWQAENQR